MYTWPDFFVVFVLCLWCFVDVVSWCCLSEIHVIIMCGCCLLVYCVVCYGVVVCSDLQEYAVVAACSVCCYCVVEGQAVGGAE